MKTLKQWTPFIFALAWTVLVVLLSERFWPHDDPIGKRISLFPPASLMRDVPDDWPGYLKLTVVGIVGNIRQNGLENDETLAQVFVPVAQARDNVSGQDAATSFSLVVRTSNDPLQYRQAIEDVVFSIDRTQPVANWQTMESLLSDSLIRRRFVMQLLTAFAVVAIVLAVVGIYGLVTYTVTQRHREMGIRLALGATASSLNRLVLREGLRLGLAGVTLGLALAAPLSRFISSQLFNTPRFDPLLYGIAATSLLLVCVLASGLPAARAARVDPAVTLRQEQ